MQWFISKDDSYFLFSFFKENYYLSSKTFTFKPLNYTVPDVQIDDPFDRPSELIFCATKNGK